MRALFFTLFFLASLSASAQRNVAVTMESLFSFDPLSNNYSPRSLPSVATYIEDWRLYEADTKLFIADSLSWGYKHYCANVDSTLIPRVLDYLDAKLLDSTDSTVILRDLSTFSQSRAYNDYFYSDIQAIRRYYATPIASLDTTLYYNAYGNNSFEALFHTFQRDITHSDFSIYSPPSLYSKLPNEVYISNIAKLLYFDNTLVVVELTASQIKEILERSASVKYYTVHSSNDDLLRYEAPAYLFATLSGTPYTINLTKKKGSRIENFRLDGSRKYRVAMNSFLARDYKILNNCGNYKELFIKWLRNSHSPLKHPTSFTLQPSKTVEEIQQREMKSIFGGGVKTP